MRIAMIGTGYVGLVSGACFSEFGHEVVCIDKDEGKIADLNGGRIPIFEPGLEEVVATNAKAGRLTFTRDLAPAVSKADAIFIAVGTPSRRGDGHADLSFVFGAAEEIARAMSGYSVVVTKSTVPVGTGRKVEDIIRKLRPDAEFDVASNPEFLREGSAILDSLYPDRVVIGADEPRTAETLYSLYRPVLEQKFQAPSYLPRPDGVDAVPLISADLASAELIKYAANAFLALKISYINEIGQLAEKVGADIGQVAKGIGLDARIGTRFLQAGIGWGGSCFGKDTAALVATASEYGLDAPIVKAAREVNRRQRERVVEKLLGELKILKGRTIGLLGLAFKPNTDDLREAPALEIAAKLIERGARVKAHDPVAMERFAQQHGRLDVKCCATPEEVARDADAVVLVTEWPQYRDLDWEAIRPTMKTPVLLDGRQLFDRERMTRAGYRYIALIG
jgi:UDPglucose 6-dehydrogenase